MQQLLESVLFDSYLMTFCMFGVRFFFWVGGGGPNPNTSKFKNNGTTNLSVQTSYILRLESNNMWLNMSLGLQQLGFCFYQTHVCLIPSLNMTSHVLKRPFCWKQPRGPEALSHTYKKQPLGGWMSSLWTWHLIFQDGTDKAIWNRNNPPWFEDLLIIKCLLSYFASLKLTYRKLSWVCWKIRFISLLGALLPMFKG